MGEHEVIPGSARDALIVELLSDVGRLHDEIKGIPKILELSMRDSIDIVADAVEDAEDTALLLHKQTKEIIQATTTKAGIDMGVELAEAIRNSLDRVFEPALNRATVKVEALEQRVASLSGNVRDTHATRFNYIMLGGFVLSALLMIGLMASLAYTAQDVNTTNKWFYDHYKAQQKILKSMPDALKQKYNIDE